VPVRVHTVVVSVQHSDKVSLEQLREEVENKVIRSVIPSKYIDDQTVFHINPCGEFIVGGPQVISLILCLFFCKIGLTHVIVFDPIDVKNVEKSP
jgi:S-adenosylmethionine synthetase, central domain